MLLQWTDEAWRWFANKDHRRVYPNPLIDEAKTWNESFVDTFITKHIGQIPLDVQHSGTALIR